MVHRGVSNTLQYDSELCINCGMCYTVCPHGVFAPNGRAVQLVDAEACMECGACQMNCPTGAITVESGVGCAAAMIWAALTGRREVTCGDGGALSCCGGDGSSPRQVESSCCVAQEPGAKGTTPSCCSSQEHKAKGTPSSCCGG